MASTGFSTNNNALDLNQEIKVYDIRGKEIILNPNQKISKGGEAQIYEVLTNNTTILFKIFTNGSLNSKYKVLRLCDQKEFIDLRKSDNLSMPLVALYRKPEKNTIDDIVGYAMLKRNGKTLKSILNLKKVEDGLVLKNKNKADLIKICLDLLDVFELLHNNNVIVGDISTNNVLYDEQSGEVAIIDNDSMQFGNIQITKYDKDMITDLKSGNGFRKKSKEQIESDRNTIDKHIVLRCIVGTDEYVAPELHGLNLSAVVRTIEMEQFSIAILFFQILMLGAHPFNSTNPKYFEIKDAIRAVDSPYCLNYTDMPYVPKGCWLNLWSYIPDEVKECFIKSFAPANNGVYERTTLEEWKTALHNYLDEVLSANSRNSIKKLIPSSMKKYIPKQVEQLVDTTTTELLGLDDLGNVVNVNNSFNFEIQDGVINIQCMEGVNNRPIGRTQRS